MTRHTFPFLKSHMDKGLWFLILLLHLVTSIQPQEQMAKVRVRRQNGFPFPTFNSVPNDLSFTCDDKLPGYYSDLETECQVWHWCTPSNQHWRFLCPNQTVFNQRLRVCDWWFNVRCDEAPNFYNINEDLYKTIQLPQDDSV